jgi:NADH-quinone oxidoreductase subunit F
MKRIASAGELELLRQSLANARDPGQPCITVCGGTGCRTSGSEAVLQAFCEETTRRGLETRVRVMATGCHGFCEQGPVVVIKPEQIFYRQVQVEDVPEIVQQTVLQGNVVDRLLYEDPATGHKIVHEYEVPFYQKQERIVLDQNGILDPTSVADYIALGGYGALGRVLTEMGPGEVIDEISASKLRGRGGAGFPTGLKWKLCRAAEGQDKYVVCNADEGDPGAYMDRSLMEGNPHRVLEGMIIGGYAIGAGQGFVYIRNEYPLAVKHLRHAIQEAQEYGLLGENILGSGFEFHVEVRLGSGAFVCGEETALMASVEGRIGEPRPRPPFPAQSGLWGHPTNINNVETWANVPLIVQNGAEWYSKLGSEASGGTKIFSVVGKINNTGLVEVPIGTALGDIVYDIGGGIPEGKAFKAAQIGGPSGGCLAKEHLNARVDYTTLQELGAIMGSGGMVICDEDTCMVDLARFFLSFVQEESCGKCIPCRVGTRAMLETLERICAGEGRDGDIEYLVELGNEIKRSSLCALGQTAPNPVLATIRYFRDEYEAHIKDKRCPAGVCEQLVVAPCINECPAGMDVPSYVALIAEDRFEEALAVALNTNPFPSVCGRVCDHRCEAKCRRSQIDEPVAIRALKRFIGDHSGRRSMPPAEQNGQPKVAIIGSGPAGLSCAYFLARLGYRPTVFEKLAIAGGMLAVGIPEYRLPKQVVAQEIEAIKAMGVEVRTSITVGKDIQLSDLQEQGYQAFFIAVGAAHSRPLGIAGEDMRGVVHGLDFLQEVHLNGHDPWVGRRVAVVGGGNAAIDAARTCLRCGAGEVNILYRRTRHEMPAQPSEVAAAEAEGIHMHFLVTPRQVIGNGHGVSGIECQRMQLGEFDSGGRRRPIPIPHSQLQMDVDMVIPAIGQFPDVSDLCHGLGVQAGRDGTIAVDKDGCIGVPYIFAGGDAVTGPATVIKAIAAGQQAAASIDQYLHPDDTKVYPWQQRTDVHTAFDPQAEPVPYGRCEVPSLLPSIRCADFDEVEQVLDRDAAVREARRCLRCDYRETEEQSACGHH